MASTANSTPVPSAQIIPLASLSSLAAYARAATVAVETDEQVNALLDVEEQVWGLILARPVTRAADAQLKLSLLLRDLLERDEADPATAMILTQVIAWLNRARAS